MVYPIAGYFHGMLNFVIFVVRHEVAQISTHKLFSVIRTYTHGSVMCVLVDMAVLP